MDHRQALREGVDADEEVLQGHVSRGKKVGTYYRLVCTAFPERPICSCSHVARLRGRRGVGSGVRALQSYDTVRKQVMDVDETGREHLGRIAKAIT